MPKLLKTSTGGSRKSRKKQAAKKQPAAKAKSAGKSSGAKSASPDLMEKLKHYVRAHAQAYLKDPNITSVGIGYKISDGKETPELSVQFSVRSKVAPESLAAVGSRLIPPAVDVDGTKVPTDIVERTFTPGYKTISPQIKDERRARAEVIRPGMSVGSVNTLAGTLGTFVRDRQSKQLVMLSNWHVFQGAAGKLGDDIVQPGKFDDNRVDQNRVGKLLRSHLGPAGDCAIASISNRQFANDIVDLGISVEEIGEPELKDKVVKSGRTTAVTYGIVTRLEVNTTMTYPGGVVEVVGGFEIGPDPDKPARGSEITRSGDSGSGWLAVDGKGQPTKIMLGLHFGGDAEDDPSSEFALACYANSVFTKLEIEPVGPMKPQAAAAEDADGFRQGFDRDFLPFSIDVPTFSNARQRDLAELEDEQELRYCHFSVWLSKGRRYPACVAWNIDGSRYKRVNRTNFRVDRRGDLEEFQLTNDIYVDNDLDRGHIARRADLCWGSLSQAKQGNYDSFYFTNIAPQHKAFNQSDDRSGDPDGGLWGRLENTVFDDKQPHGLRISLMGGPVISRADRKFVQNEMECFLPREYWKVVAYVDDEDNKEKVFAFILTQASLIEGLVRPEGIDFDEWLWARITLNDLQSKTGVIFPRALHDREVKFARPQALGAPNVKPLFHRSEYFA